MRMLDISHLEEINPPVSHITNSPGLRVIEMYISRDGSLLGKVSVGQGASSSIKWIIVSVCRRLEPAGERHDISEGLKKKKGPEQIPQTSHPPKLGTSHQDN